MSRGNAYVSIVDWPRGFSRLDQVTALVKAIGMDPFHAEQRVAKPPPMVVARVPEAVAGAAADVLHELGVTAFVLTDGEIERAAPPVRAKRLEPAQGAPEPMYLVERWHSRTNERLGLVCSELFLLVRAKLARTKAGESRVESSMTWDPVVGVHTQAEIVRTTESNSTDVMDLHMRDGTRIRIDGQKFNFDMLGAQRGHSDTINADRLALLLATQSPRAIVDTSFALFSAGGGLLRSMGRRVGLDGRTFRNDQPLFEFYSIWAGALYRSMMGGKP